MTRLCCAEQKKLRSTRLSYLELRNRCLQHYINFETIALELVERLGIPELYSHAVVITRDELLQLQSSRSWYVDFGWGR